MAPNAEDCWVGLYGLDNRDIRRADDGHDIIPYVCGGKPSGERRGDDFYPQKIQWPAQGLFVLKNEGSSLEDIDGNEGREL